MASLVYNAGAKGIADGSIDFATDTIKIALLTDAYTPDKDHASMTTPAASELSVTGYAGGFAGAGRKTLASKTITKDDTNDRVKFDAADPSTWSSLASGATIAYAIIYKHITDDATSVPLFLIDFTDTPTNGGDFTLAFSASGIAYLQQ